MWGIAKRQNVSHRTGQCNHACPWHFHKSLEGSTAQSSKSLIYFQGQNWYALLWVQMGLERQEAKHHMKHAEQTEKCMHPDQNGTFPEHSIQASIHVTSHSAMTLLNLYLLNTAMITRNCTCLYICKWVHNWEFLQLKNSTENLASLYTGPKTSFLTSRVSKSNICFLFDL